ncbi:hypothetical protein Pcinc_006031, partial [Petrolisthes cinctipes]
RTNPWSGELKKVTNEDKKQKEEEEEEIEGKVKMIHCDEKGEQKEKKERDNNEEVTKLMKEAADSSTPSDKTIINNSGVPDGGWGWCVVLAGTVSTMFALSLGHSFGVLYGHRLEMLEASPELESWLFSALALTWNSVGPWTEPLAEVFTYRQLAVFGSLLISFSFFLSAFVTFPPLLFITFSLFIGVGGGLTSMCCYQTLPHYFHKRLGLANGIIMSGGSLGCMLMPQFASFLLEHYPFQMTSLIIGATLLNSSALLTLLHPVHWHYRPNQPSPTSRNTTDNTTVPHSKQTERARVPRRSSVPHELMKLSGGGGGMYEEPVNAAFHTTPTPGERIHTLSKQRQYLIKPWTSSLQKLSTSSLQKPGTSSLQNTEGSIPFNMGSASLVWGSGLLGSILTLDQQQHNQYSDASNGGVEKNEEEYRRERSAWQRVWIRFRSLYNLRLISDPLATGLALGSSLTMTASTNILVAIPFLLIETGYPLQSVATAMSTAAVVDLVSRLAVSPITDLPCVNVCNLYRLGQLVFSTVPFVLVSKVDEWWVVLLCMALFGMGLSIIYVLDVFIVIRVMGVQHLSSVYGLCQFFRCLIFCVLGPVGGELRKTTGNYTASIIFYSCVMWTGFLFLLATSIYSYCSSKDKASSLNDNHSTHSTTSCS